MHDEARGPAREFFLIKRPFQPGEFRRAGVRPLMLTGDQTATAEAVAESLGLNGGGQPVTLHANELDRLDARAAARLARSLADTERSEGD